MNLFPGVTPANGQDEPPQEKKQTVVRRTSNPVSAHGDDMIQSPTNRDFANDDFQTNWIRMGITRCEGVEMGCKRVFDVNGADS